MASPKVVSVSPLNQATDVVLGTTIVITFDQPMNQTSISSDTFLLEGPGQTAVINPDQLIADNPQALTGRQYYTGTFSWNSDSTIVTFTPYEAFQPNLTYQVLLVGSNSLITTAAVKSLAGINMVDTYQWSFQTGVLDLTAPPAASPTPQLISQLDPNSIKVVPRVTAVGNDLSHEIDFVFPANIDPNSFNIGNLLISIEPVVGDPSVRVPSTLNTAVTIVDNKMKFTITGWPPDDHRHWH